MTAPNAAPAASPTEASGSTSGADGGSPYTLDAEISALLGGGFSSGSADESPTDAGGAPPPASSESPAPEPSGTTPPDEAASEHAGAPPAASAQPPADEDFLKDAKPLTYVVNGETRTFDGITAVGDKGAFITAEHLPKLQQRLSERDHLYEKDQASYQRLTQLEAQRTAFDQLTAWPNGKDAQGRDQFLTGTDAIEARNVLIGQMVARLNTLTQALDNPETFRELVDVRMDDQGQVFVFAKPAVVKALTTESELAAMRAEQSVRQAFRAAKGAMPQGPPPTNGTPPTADLASVTSEQALATVESIVQSQAIGGLTAEDKQYLATQVLPRFIRPTTADERAQHGARIVDNSFIHVVRREAEHRTQLSQTASSAQSAAQFNTRQLAAAALGTSARRPPAAAPARAAAAPSPAEDAEDAKWAMMERLAGRA